MLPDQTFPLHRPHEESCSPDVAQANDPEASSLGELRAGTHSSVKQHPSGEVSRCWSTICLTRNAREPREPLPLGSGPRACTCFPPAEPPSRDMALPACPGEVPGPGSTTEATIPRPGQCDLSAAFPWPLGCAEELRGAQRWRALPTEGSRRRGLERSPVNKPLRLPTLPNTGP